MPRSGSCVASAARTASGNGATQTASGSSLAAMVRASAVSGALPTLAVQVHWSMDGVNFGPADPADAFTPITAAGALARQFTVKASHYRFVWSIGGTTPSFTFSIDTLEW